MTVLTDLEIQDLRPYLNVIDRPKCRRVRQGAVTSVTLHYNGPALGTFGDPDRELKHLVEIDVPDHQTRINADSLMYHLVVLSDGSVWQTRDLELQAWHCANAEGNEHSIAVHLPLGGTQDATPAQWEATTTLFEALIGEYFLSGRQAVKGHQEWSATLCPGALLMNRLRAWRAEESYEPYTGGVLRIRSDVSCANVREGPGRAFPVALGGQAVMWPGDVLYADAIVSGEAIGGEVRWGHRIDNLGYVHFSLLEPLA
jgi:hypothetical protein